MITEGNGLTIKAHEGNRNIKMKLSDEITELTDKFLLNKGKIQFIDNFVSGYNAKKFNKEAQVVVEFKKNKERKAKKKD